MIISGPNLPGTLIILLNEVTVQNACTDIQVVHGSDKPRYSAALNDIELLQVRVPRCSETISGVLGWNRIATYVVLQDLIPSNA